jgi:ketosteroid isomerase-like protein
MRSSVAAFTMVLLSMVAAFSASPAAADETDAKAVRAASDNFYLALNAMFAGEVEPMLAAWSHESDVTYMGPAGGVQTGWHEVQAVWTAQAALKLGGEVQGTNMRMTVSGDLAVVSGVEVGQNFAADGSPEYVEIRATNVFRKENGHWKMIGHHTDLLPFLQK